MTFERAVFACWDNAEFMRQYRRLTGAQIGLRPTRDPFSAMIDAATGVPTIDPKEAADFFRFVRDYVWIPVLAKILEERAKR